MADGHTTTAMRKLIKAAQNEATHAPADHAITLALARVGQDKLGLSLGIRHAQETRMTLADLPEIIPDHALRLIIEGAGDATGMLILDPDLTAAIIQMQTMGRLRRILPHHRHPTRTDASLSVEFVDAVLCGIEQEMAASPDLEWAGGFRYASWIESNRPLATLLDEIPYRVWTIHVDLGTDDNTGKMIWVIPEQGCGPRPKPHVPKPLGETLTLDTEWGASLGQTVMESHVTLDAVLHRVSLPLTDVMTFHVGMDLPLPSASLTAIRLESNRRTLSHGRLGQFKGDRAILLTAIGAEERTSKSDFPQPDEGIQPIATLKIA